MRFLDDSNHRLSDDSNYYAGRTLEEMERGDGAVDPSIAAIHYELAHRYALLAAPTSSRAPNLTLVHGGKEQIAA